MKLSKPKYRSYSTSYSKTGKKKGYQAEINYNHINKNFYFMIIKDNYIFNSLWKFEAYKTEEEAAAACEKYIDELTAKERNATK